MVVGDPSSSGASERTVSLWVFERSHPCEAVVAAAEWKGVRVRRVELPPVAHRAIMRARFGESGRVPGMRVGGRGVQGTTAIFRALDELAPGTPWLFPPQEPLASAVVEAERWGAGDLQDSGRRLIWGHFRRCPEAMATWADRTEDPRARWVKRRLGGVAAMIAATANGATPEAIREDLRRMPEVLARADALVADGVIGRVAPNAADFQVLSTIGLWMVLADLRPLIIDRPCGEAAARLFPYYVAEPGVAGGVLPADWLAPARSAT